MYSLAPERVRVLLLDQVLCQVSIPFFHHLLSQSLRQFSRWLIPFLLLSRHVFFLIPRDPLVAVLFVTCDCPCGSALSVSVRRTCAFRYLSVVVSGVSMLHCLSEMRRSASAGIPKAGKALLFGAFLAYLKIAALSCATAIATFKSSGSSSFAISLHCLT